MRRDPPVIVLLVALLAACGEAGASGPVITVTDSAGIEIVTNPGDDSGLPVWRVDTVPLLSIGLVDGETPYLLDAVRYATTLDDGRIAIVNTGTDEVRLFDAEGGHLRTFGGSGGGPGEYGFPARAWQRGDSLVVVDVNANRITIQPLDGSTPRTLGGVPETRPSVNAMTIGDALILPIQPREFPPPGQSITESITYVRLPLDGSAPDTLLVLPNGLRTSQEVTLDGRATFLIGPRLFETHAHAGSMNGGFVAGSSARPEVSVIDPAVGTTRIIRWTGAATPITDDHLETYLADLVAASDGPRDAEFARQRVASAQRPDSFPRFDAILGNREHLWVRSYRLPGDTGPRRWRVHDAEGRLVAVAEVPDGLTLYEVAPDRVLALTNDELDVQHVVVLPVEPVR